MKKIKYFTLLGLMTFFFAFISCEDEDKEAYNIHNQAENVAPYVRIILDKSTVDSAALPSALINATVSAPANNVKSWSLKVKISGSQTTSYTDLITINSFPSDFTISVQEIADKLGININSIQAADVIEFSGTSEGFDGKTLSYGNLAGDLSGQPEQRQAYDFDVVVFCSPVSSNFIGDWTIVTVDAYGDGWNGGYITATVDGVATNYAAAGTGTTHVVSIPSGTTSLVWSYTPGAWEEENTFTMEDPAGATYGPFMGANGIPFCFF